MSLGCLHIMMFSCIRYNRVREYIIMCFMMSLYDDILRSGPTNQPPQVCVFVCACVRVCMGVCMCVRVSAGVYVHMCFYARTCLCVRILSCLFMISFHYNVLSPRPTDLPPQVYMCVRAYKCTHMGVYASTCVCADIVLFCLLGLGQPVFFESCASTWAFRD